MSPIKGLTDNLTPRFASLGKLRKGGEKPAQGNKPGQDLDYFRFTSPRQEVQKAFDEIYGTQPAMLHVYLPYVSVDDNFTSWRELWAGGGLLHRCDGETCIIWLGEDKHYHREPKPCPGGCKPVGRLSVILPELWKAGYIGYVTLETHSLHDLMNIQAALMATLDGRGDNPLGLRGIEFVLRRMPEEISVPGFGQNAGKRQHVEKWLVRLEPAQDWVLLQLEATRAQTMMIEPGVVVDSETGEVIDPPWDDEPEKIEPVVVKVEPVKQADPPKAGGAWHRQPTRVKAWAEAMGKQFGMETGEILATIGKLGIYENEDAASKGLLAKLEESEDRRKTLEKLIEARDHMVCEKY